MNICLFSPEELGLPLAEKDERAQHIVKILHKKSGDSFKAGIIGGAAGYAVITKIDSGTVFYDFTAESNGKELIPLKMIIGFPRPIQLKRLLRDIAALGVCEVHLTGTELGEKSYMNSTLVERGAAYKMLLDGTVQAGSTHIPSLFMHKTLAETLDCINGIADTRFNDRIKAGDKELRIALDNVNPKIDIKTALQESKGCHNVCAAIGSERGWTDRERTQLEEAGFIRAGMGERIMRTETAATAAAAIISCFTGMMTERRGNEI
ncbi:MAG: RsmE family RNA methyltransferase [Treponema sp.]